MREKSEQRESPVRSLSLCSFAWHAVPRADRPFVLSIIIFLELSMFHIVDQIMK